ncbi:MAG: hypothetical protein QM817_32305 [Archangium sp.]
MTEDVCVAQLQEAPGDDARWAVYADLLQARGDLRGELIALSLTRKSRRERLFRQKHHAALGLTAVLGLLDENRLSVDWEHGHLATLTLQRGQHVRRAPWSLPRVVNEVLSHPLAFALHRVNVAAPANDEDAQALVEALVANGAAVSDLTLWLEGTRLHAAPLLRLPLLTKLSLSSVATLDSASAARLEELTVFAFDEQSWECRLGTLEAPRLRALSLRSWTDTRPAVSRWVREACRAPNLRRLSLEVRFTSQVIEAIADSVFAKSLEKLSVITMDEASAEVLLRRRADLPRLISVSAHQQRVPQATELRLRAEFSGR